MTPTVLAVDDDEGILRILSTALEAEGYRVLTAESARAFREIDAAEDVDVYLIDITLPDGNGFSLIRDLRRRSESGVIVLSGRSGETDHVVGLELGADDYVNKPFRVRELCSRVNAVYRRISSQGSRAAPQDLAPPQSTPIESAVDRIDYEFDGIRVCLAARAIFDSNGADIELTTAEFDLLAALLRRRGQVLSRDQLMNAIKGQDWTSYDRAVDGLVSRLRRKLDSTERKGSCIRTVHGIGYAFTR